MGGRGAHSDTSSEFTLAHHSSLRDQFPELLMSYTERIRDCVANDCYHDALDTASELSATLAELWAVYGKARAAEQNETMGRMRQQLLVLQQRESRYRRFPPVGSVREV